jgi:hypothetical protein
MPFNLPDRADAAENPIIGGHHCPERGKPD